MLTPLPSLLPNRNVMASPFRFARPIPWEVKSHGPVLSSHRQVYWLDRGSQPIKIIASYAGWFGRLSLGTLPGFVYIDDPAPTPRRRRVSCSCRQWSPEAPTFQSCDRAGDLEMLLVAPTRRMKSGHLRQRRDALFAKLVTSTCNDLLDTQPMPIGLGSRGLIA